MDWTADIWQVAPLGHRYSAMGHSNRKCLVRGFVLDEAEASAETAITVNGQMERNGRFLLGVNENENEQKGEHSDLT